MDSKPDTIKVAAFHKEEIFASYANLYVTVRGSSVISGNEALKKAREVSQLVEELTRPAPSESQGSGLGPEAVQLQGVHIETASGTLLRSSSAIYRLKVQTETVDQIPRLLDILADQKNATLERIEWKYAEDEARQQALEVAITKGKAKAEKVAASLGVRLLGVYDFMENTFDEDRPPMPFQAMEMSMKARPAAAAEPSLSIGIQHGKTIQAQVDIWYRVSGLESP